MPQRRDVKAPEKVDIQMTPMIDIVFQLMAFFLMTFKVANVEGDFNLKVPKAEMSQGPANSQVDNVAVYLTAAADPALLAGINVGEESYPMAEGDPDDTEPFEDLRTSLAKKIQKAADAGLPEPEIMIHIPGELKYQYVLKTIEAVSVHFVDGKTVQLAKKIKLLRN